MTALAHLAGLVAACESGQPVPPDDAAWLIEGTRRAATDGVRLDVALGIARRGGGGGIARMAALARRDSQLRELHRRHFLHLDARPAARAILALAGRRRRSRAAPSGEAERAIDALLRDGVPLPAERRLAAVLATTERLENTVLNYLRAGSRHDT